MLVFVLVCITLCPFEFYNHLDEEENAGIFAFIVFVCLDTVNVLWLSLMVSCVGLQFVIEVFLVILTYLLSIDKG